MQSIFRLPWCSEHLSEKGGSNLDKMRPMVEIPGLKELKRKRADSSDLVIPEQTMQPFKKQEQNFLRQLAPAPPQVPAQQHTAYQQPVTQPHVPQQSVSPTNTSVALPTPSAEKEIRQTVATQPSPAQPATDISSPKASTDDAMVTESKAKIKAGDNTRLKQVIENEFNMQILMKHNELRLIEQELAKCQIALEQLRRCELRPYPGATAPSSQVSEGVGAAVMPPPGFSRPSHPAPYGVTDGPYSRHYKQWLLHDPQFDSVSPEAISFAEARVNAAARSTRNQGHHVKKSTSKSLGTSTRSADPMQSIPNYPAAPAKDKSAPLVLKRSTDGQLVKLICNSCHRGNFSSIQGFLNHCRIAHKQDYKSHDAAAIDCGQLLDADEKANLPPEAHAAPAPKSNVSRASTCAAPNPAKIHASGLVHPYNTGNTAPAVAQHPSSRKPSVPVSSSTLSNPPFDSAPFKPSGQAPRLSHFMSKHNAGGDLEQAVAMAKQRINLDADEDMMSPDTTSDPNSPIVAFGPGARTIGGKQSYFPQRPVGHKGQRPRPAPLAPAPPHHAHMSSQMSSPQDSASATLSPNAVDSNPGMVSDHDDDDHSVSEEDHPQPVVTTRPPLSAVGRACSNEMDIDIEDEQIDGITQRGVIIRRNSMLANDARATVGGK